MHGGTVMPTDPFDDSTTPVLVSGVLAGLLGGVAGSMPPVLAAVFRGDGPAHPAKLVAASLMGAEALDRANALPAALLGALLTLVSAAALGVVFALLRKREVRMRVLFVEGVGFGLVILAALWFTLPYLNPTMAARQPILPLVFGYALFGACLAVELPLRVGSVRFDEREARASLEL